MNGLVVQIQIIPKPLSYWTTNDPIIPHGSAAFVTDNNSSTIRPGDGIKKWSQLPDIDASIFVACHSPKHAANGIDPLIATDVEYTAGVSTTRVPSIKQIATNLINSPVFTGTPKAPTAATGTNTTQIATTAFVTAAIGSVSLIAKQTTAPTDTKLLWLNTVDATLNYYDTTTSKWVSIVGRYFDAP